MDFIQSFGDFLLNVWLWNITFDWFHPIVAGIIMFFMFRMILRKRRIPSVLVSVGAQLFTLTVLYLVIKYGLVDMLNWEYEPMNAQYALALMNEVFATLSVGLVYAVLQSIYFIIGRFIWNYNLLAYLLIAWISNGIGMLLSYFLIRLVILWQYPGDGLYG